MSDLISRQAAIDAVGNMLRRKFGTGGDLAEITLAGLSSAHPELDEWCDTCKEYDKERHCCPRWSRVIKATLEDAKLERKKGKWIPHKLPNGEKSIDKDVCSRCRRRFYQIAETGCTWNYCPNCGADMRGEEDGNKR